MCKTCNVDSILFSTEEGLGLDMLLVVNGGCPGHDVHREATVLALFEQFLELSASLRG